MVKRFNLKRIFILMASAGIVSVGCNNAIAAGFALWEQDAASIGNYHAGIAAEAADASTAWYNPAGLVNIKNQQLILGADGVMTDFKFRGTVGVSTLLGPTGLPLPPAAAVGQGGAYNTVPFLHYAAPVSEHFFFGMSIDAPFGLRTDYGNNPPISYSATLTSLQVIDYTPSIGIKFTDKFSMGAGFDIQKLSAEFDNIDTLGIVGILPPQDTISQNEASDTGYGYRIGALLQPCPSTRIGVNYRSKVSHHAKGNSYFNGPLANSALGGSQASTNLTANATLPASTTLSVFQTVTNNWDVMGTVAYTQWSIFKDLVLQNVSGINAALIMSNSIVVDIPEHYHNAWNLSFGANYHPDDKWIIRTGIGWDQSPTNNNYRNLQLPDNDRIGTAIGAHYQAWKVVGFDFGWTHLFLMNTRINNLSQTEGAEVVTTNGSVRGSADVFGAQVKWDIT